MKNINPEIQEAQHTWGGTNENKSTLRHVTRNLLETNNENKILIGVKAKGHITYRRITEIVVDFSLKKKKKKDQQQMWAKKQWDGIFKYWKKKSSLSRVLCLVKKSFRTGEINSLSY